MGGARPRNDSIFPDTKTVPEKVGDLPPQTSICTSGVSARGSKRADTQAVCLGKTVGIARID